MGFVDWRSKILLMYTIYKPWVYILYIYEKNFGMCLWPEFDWYKVTLCGWQDIKIQLLTYPCFDSSYTSRQSESFPLVFATARKQRRML